MAASIGFSTPPGPSRAWSSPRTTRQNKEEDRSDDIVPETPSIDNVTMICSPVYRDRWWIPSEERSNNTFLRSPELESGKQSEMKSPVIAGSSHSRGIEMSCSINNITTPKKHTDTHQDSEPFISPIMMASAGTIASESNVNTPTPRTPVKKYISKASIQLTPVILPIPIQRLRQEPEWCRLSSTPISQLGQNLQSDATTPPSLPKPSTPSHLADAVRGRSPCASTSFGSAKRARFMSHSQPKPLTPKRVTFAPDIMPTPRRQRHQHGLFSDREREAIAKGFGMSCFEEVRTYLNSLPRPSIRWNSQESGYETHGEPESDTVSELASDTVMRLHGQQTPRFRGLQSPASKLFNFMNTV